MKTKLKPVKPSSKRVVTATNHAMVLLKERELAVLEMMDGGKPIKESRDIDLPLVAADFFNNK